MIKSAKKENIFIYQVIKLDKVQETLLYDSSKYCKSMAIKFDGIVLRISSNRLEKKCMSISEKETNAECRICIQMFLKEKRERERERHVVDRGRKRERERERGGEIDI